MSYELFSAQIILGNLGGGISCLYILSATVLDPGIVRCSRLLQLVTERMEGKTPGQAVEALRHIAAARLQARTR